MFKIGERVEVPCHYDCWMKGDQNGVVKGEVRETTTASGNAVTSCIVGVRMDISKKLYWFPVADYMYFRFLGREA